MYNIHQKIVGSDDLSNFTVNDLLEKREIGTTLPLVVNVNDSDVPIFFIKDQKETIENINEEELVAMKSSILGDNRCFLLLILFKFNNDFSTAYDVWFNYAYDWHKDFLKVLNYSEKIIIDFRNEDNERVKTIEIKNEIKNTLSEYINKSEEFTIIKESSDDKVIHVLSDKRYKLWKDEDADKITDAIFDSYDSIEDLWNNM